MKHKFVGVIAMGLLVFNIVGAVPALAVDITPSPSAQQIIVPYAEEFTWYYRTVSGVKQKRLWSTTRDMWVTDWVNY